MTPNVPFMAVLPMTGVDIIYTETVMVPAPNSGPGSQTGQGVPQSSERIIDRTFQELQFRGDPANAGVISIGVIVNGVVVYGEKLRAGDARNWRGEDIKKISMSLKDFHFNGAAGDNLLISGLPNRQ